MTGLTAYMAIMCLMEAWKIWGLIKRRQLHTHYLFELARSDTMYDRNTNAWRINNTGRDDDANTRNPSRAVQQTSNYQLFHGEGSTLGSQTSASPTDNGNNTIVTGMNGNTMNSN